MAIPGTVFPELPKLADLFQPDKIIHIAIFGIYIYLQIKGFYRCDHIPWLKKHAVFLALSIGFMIGAGTELLQQFVIPFRRGDIFDFTANVAGCTAGYFSVRKWLYTN